MNDIACFFQVFHVDLVLENDVVGHQCVAYGVCSMAVRAAGIFIRQLREGAEIQVDHHLSRFFDPSVRLIFDADDTSG